MCATFMMEDIDWSVCGKMDSLSSIMFADDVHDFTSDEVVPINIDFSAETEVTDEYEQELGEFLREVLADDDMGTLKL
jgi:hypothetical protein